MKIRRLSLLGVAVLMFFSFGCHERDGRTLENRMIGRNFMAAWSAHDVGKLTALFAEDGLYEEVATGNQFRGRKEIAGYAKATLDGVPDSVFGVVDVLADEDMATVEWVWKGTNTAGWPDMGIPATNKSFELRGVSVMVIKDHLIQRNSDYWDWNTFIRRIGAAPAESASAAVKSLISQWTQLYNARNFEKLMSVFYADDAILMSPNAPLHKGKESILLSYRKDDAENIEHVETSEVEDVRVSGDLAVAQGTDTGTTTPRSSGRPVKYSLKWLMVFEHQSGGSWKCLYEIWNENPIPEATEKKL
jgi:steroid delta-isomerase-like uncharacterized protein